MEGPARANEGLLAEIASLKQRIEELEEAESQRKTTEEALEKSRMDLLAIIDNLPFLAWLKDSEGHFLAVNEPFARSCGLPSADDLIGKTDYDVWPKELAEAYRADDAEVMRTQQKKFVEERIADQGIVKWFETYKAPLYDVEGNVTGTTGLARDISERKQIEEQLLYAQRLEMAGRVAAQVAHDLNNLLVPLTSYPVLIKRSLPPGHPAAKFCDIMIRSAKQMADINTELLALGRRGQVSLEPTDINSLIWDALAQVPPPGPELRIDLDLAEDLLKVRGAGAQLTRVFTNLLSNARDAMRDTGLLSLKTENYRVDESSDQRDRVPAGKYVRVQVKDTGCGIPEEALPQIFDPFYTTKRADQQRGSGLGLTVVQAIVADHSGFIDVESRVGYGTTFSVYLPVTQEAVEPAEDQNAPQGSGLILVVDDDEVQRAVAEQMLRTLGYDVAVVASGEEAVGYLRNQAVDLVLLDMVMPGGIDGTETYRRILEIHPEQKAVLLSAFGETERVEEALRLGVTMFLRKPATRAHLARAVKGILL